MLNHGWRKILKKLQETSKKCVQRSVEEFFSPVKGRNNPILVNIGKYWQYRGAFRPKADGKKEPTEHEIELLEDPFSQSKRKTGLFAVRRGGKRILRLITAAREQLNVIPFASVSELPPIVFYS